MIKKTALFLSLILTGVGFSQENSLLWKITGKGLPFPSYLYGTIHINDVRVKSFDTTFYATINECNVLSGEILLEKGVQGNLLSQANVMMLPDSITLESLYESKDEYRKVNKAIDSIVGPMSFVVKKMKPFYIAGMIEVLGYENESSTGQPVDAFLQEYAKKQGLKTVGIESVESQLNAIDSIPLEEQAVLLYETISSRTENDEMEQFLQAYLEQDLEEISTIMFAENVKGGVEKFLFEKRNKEMAKKIIELIKSEPTFNTFGAGHLIGEKGIIALLKKEGYTVQPVPFLFRLSKQ